MKIFHLVILILPLIQSCDKSNKESDKMVSNVEYDVDMKAIQCADSLTFDGWANSVMDLQFGYCDESSRKCYNYLRDSTALQDLYHIYNLDSIGYGLKLRLFNIIYRRDTLNRDKLLQPTIYDTTTIQHNTSCMGILYHSTYAEDCFKIAFNEATSEERDSLMLDVVQTKDYQNILPFAIMYTIKNELSSPDLEYKVKDLSRLHPEALVKYSTFDDHDTAFVRELIESSIAKGDTSYFIQASRIFIYTSMSDYKAPEDSVYFSWYNKAISRHKLHNYSRLSETIDLLSFQFTYLCDISSSEDFYLHDLEYFVDYLIKSHRVGDGSEYYINRMAEIFLETRLDVYLSNKKAIDKLLLYRSRSIENPERYSYVHDSNYNISMLDFYLGVVH